MSFMAAMIGFFVLAAIGWLNGVPVWACSVRSIAGACVVYVTLQLAGRLAVAILASAAVGGMTDADSTRSDSGLKK
ncbi:MAG: hypothetical protein NT031_09325 [Planctomycetota bacterium]|nr:hypothetical protein [Planctomycetota bacterium]